ncbi:MAG TPA: hypothetical protein VFD36_19095, partial [Kofleriaceae bacterium]|nr:hypothetical protein [Kofleriaceae bacterium]
MKRARLTIAPALALVALIALGATASVRADDLPSEIVARPATLPHRMIALTLAGGYDSAHVLGISVLSTTQLHLAVQRGMTQRLEMSLASGFAVHPDAGWTRDGTVALAYRAWHRDTVELAPSLTVPLSFHSGADLTSTIVLGAGVRWHVAPCVLLPLAAACTSPPAIELPGARPGIGFDDLRYSARLHRVLVPGGRSGNLALVDPDTHDIRTIGGFSTSASFDAGGHDFGITSVDDLGSLLAVSDRTSGKVSLVDVDRGFVFAACAEGRVAVLDAKDGHVVSDSWVVDGVDVIDFSLSRRHLYAPGQISANLGIFGVSTTGALGVLAIEDGTLYGHCVTTDDAG